MCEIKGKIKSSPFYRKFLRKSVIVIENTKKVNDMMNEYKTVYEGGVAEIVEKKSRFIATVLPVKTEEEAIAFIDAMKKKYWNATHNCFAYVIGKNLHMQRCSDDGEPSGTAGKPMLDVLLGEAICNVAVVVTRYFGGTLLGTGGLVRAYSSATKAGLMASTVITKQYGQKMIVRTDYTGLGKIQYILAQRGLTILDTVYTENVQLEVLLPEDEIKTVMAEITEGTNGQAIMDLQQACYFAEIGGKMQIFDE